MTKRPAAAARWSPALRGLNAGITDTSDAGRGSEPSGFKVGLSSELGSGPHVLPQVSLQMGLIVNDSQAEETELLFNIEVQPSSRLQLLSKDLQENPLLLKLKRSVSLDVSMVKIINAAHSYAV